MVKRIMVVGKTWWGETLYRDVDTGRPVRWTWSVGMFYYDDEEGGYIFDDVEVIN